MINKTREKYSGVQLEVNGRYEGGLCILHCTMKEKRFQRLNKWFILHKTTRRSEKQKQSKLMGGLILLKDDVYIFEVFASELT